MKKTFATLFVFVMVFTALSYARILPKVSKADAAYFRIENNYLKGLNSDNQQLKISCAYFLGEMQSKKAVIPLMAMFRNSKNDGAKLVAAWSLLKIGDARGVYLVKSSIESDDYSNISSMLRYFYMDYCLKNNGKINQS